MQERERFVPTLGPVVDPGSDRIRLVPWRLTRVEPAMGPDFGRGLIVEVSSSEGPRRERVELLALATGPKNHVLDLVWSGAPDWMPSRSGMISWAQAGLARARMAGTSASTLEPRGARLDVGQPGKRGPTAVSLRTGACAGMNRSIGSVRAYTHDGKAF